MNDAPLDSSLKVVAFVAIAAVWGVAAWAFSPSGSSAAAKTCPTCSLAMDAPLPVVSDTLSPSQFLAPPSSETRTVAMTSPPSFAPAIAAPATTCRTHPTGAPAKAPTAGKTCGTGNRANGNARPAGPSELIGKQASALSLKKVGGGQIDLTPGTGVTVLEFWRQTCPHCRRTLPQVARLAEAYSGRSVRFLGINEDRTLPDDKVLEFAKSVGVQDEIARDDAMEASRAYRATGLPTIIVISGSGVIEAAHVGERSDLDQTLARELDVLLSGGTHTSFSTAKRTS